jgi:hypothetical protein
LHASSRSIHWDAFTAFAAIPADDALPDTGVDLVSSVASGADPSQAELRRSALQTVRLSFERHYAIEGEDEDEECWVLAVVRECGDAEQHLLGFHGR